MKVLNYGGIAWATIYLAVGALSSFTINNIETYSSITLLVLTFLLPLPITIFALWRPIKAGVALILCVAISAATFFFLYGAKDTATALSKGFYVPHLIFGVAYIMVGRAPKDTNPSIKRTSPSGAALLR